MNFCIYKPIIELKKIINFFYSRKLSLNFKRKSIIWPLLVYTYNSVISFEEVNLYFCKSNDGMCKKFKGFNVPDI